MYGALGDILTSIVLNSHFWKRTEAPDMTIFGSLLIGALGGRGEVGRGGRVEEREPLLIGSPYNVTVIG